MLPSDGHGVDISVFGQPWQNKRGHARPAAVKLDAMPRRDRGGRSLRSQQGVVEAAEETAGVGRRNVNLLHHESEKKNTYTDRKRGG